VAEMNLGILLGLAPIPKPVGAKVVKLEVEHHVKKKGTNRTKDGTTATVRRDRIVEIITIGGAIRFVQLRSCFDVSDSVLYADLSALVKEKKLCCNGTAMFRTWALNEEGLKNAEKLSNVINYDEVVPKALSKSNWRTTRQIADYVKDFAGGGISSTSRTLKRMLTAGKVRQKLDEKGIIRWKLT
jgi:hypothetical protein